MIDVVDEIDVEARPDGDVVEGRADVVEQAAVDLGAQREVLAAADDAFDAPVEHLRLVAGVEQEADVAAERRAAGLIAGREERD